jgi:hypothetical protein
VRHRTGGNVGQEDLCSPSQEIGNVVSDRPLLGAWYNSSLDEVDKLGCQVDLFNEAAMRGCLAAWLTPLGLTGSFARRVKVSMAVVAFEIGLDSTA